MYFKRKYRNAVWGASLSIGASIMLIPILLGFYSPQAPYMIPISPKANNIIAFGFIVALGIPALVEFSNQRWVRQVERNIPRLLRDVSEAVQSGVTLPKALEEASQRDYGPISKELEHTISMFNLGATWEESLMSLAQRLSRPSALRLSTILIEANQTGGRMNEILDSSVDLFSDLDEYREERYNSMRPYLLTVYMATVVFLIIAYVVLHQFLAPLSSATATPLVKESGLLASVLDINYYTSILFWASLIESIFGGIIAGKMGGANLSAGLPHSVALMAATLVFFNIAGV